MTTSKAIGREPIAVVGAGLTTPGGSTVEQLFDALCAARSTAEVYVDDRLPRDARLLVSRGIGCSGVPVRLFAQPEVHVCQLVSAAGTGVVGRDAA